MVFSSLIFLFLFLPLVILIYVLLPRRARNYFLLASSLLFYFWGEKYLIWILLTTIITDFTCGWLIAGDAARRGEPLPRNVPRSRYQKLILIFSLTVNLSLLAYFKYCNFFVDNTLSFLSAMGWSGPGIFEFTKVALPLGISFYTFQSMSYTIDVYRGEVKASRHFFDFACYVTMFPQLVAGPIIRYRDLQDQMDHHELSPDLFSLGVKRFIIGLSKKVLIANTIALTADSIFALPPNDLSCHLAWLGVLCYALQIYYDFSGYSDMAIGLGLMFGFRFPENFNYPYFSCSVREFWQRWHISLSTWFRDYLYIPLGGNRGTAPRVCCNLLTVFFLCGLWHGASWNFVVWGMFHGALMMFERLGFGKILSALPRVLQHLYLLLAVLIGWVFFRCESMTAAGHYLYAMFGLGSASSCALDAMYYRPVMVIALFAGIVFAMPLIPRLHGLSLRFASTGPLLTLYNALVMVTLFLLLALSSLYLTAGAYNPFIYFRF